MRRWCEGGIRNRKATCPPPSRSSQFSILNYRRGAAVETGILSSQFSILNYRRGAAVRLIEAGLPAVGSVSLQVLWGRVCRAGARRSQGFHPGCCWISFFWGRPILGPPSSSSASGRIIPNCPERRHIRLPDSQSFSGHVVQPLTAVVPGSRSKGSVVVQAMNAWVEAWSSYMARNA